MPELTNKVAPPPEAQSGGWRWVHWCVPWALLVGIGLTLVTAVVIVLASIVPQIRQLVLDCCWPKAPTWGDIYVNTPKVYTRERLVNDRFRQQAWLDSQLQRTEELLKGRAFAGIEGQSIRRERQSVSVAAGVGANAQESDTQAAEGGPPAATPGVKPDRDTFLPEPIDEFRDALAYRDEIRAELMRTQLDDRHDLRGNTLYRLDFDVTIAPGDNTRAPAKITIKVEEDDRPKKLLKQYELLYADWQKVLQRTINSAIKYQTQAILRSRLDLDDSEQVPLQEFIAREFCQAVSNIVATNERRKSTGAFLKDLFGFFQHAKAEDAVSCEGVNSAVQQAAQQAVTGYVSAYLQVKQDDLDRDSVVDLVKAVKKTVKGGHPERDLPEPLRALLSEDEDNINSRDPQPLSPAQRKALAYANRICRRSSKEGQFELEADSPSVPPLSFPCPYSWPPLEPLRGAITMLERVRLLGNLGQPKLNDLGVADPAKLIERIRCLIDPNELRKSAAENLKELPDCSSLFDALRSAASQAPQKDDRVLGDHLYGLPQVRPAFVQKLIAEYMAAKLNNELRSWRVLRPLKYFFNLRLGSCELKACILLLESKVQASSEPKGRLAYNDTMLTDLRAVLNVDVHTFAYTVTPTEMVQRLASEASTRATLHAVLRTTVPNRDTVQTVLDGLRDLEHQSDMRYRNPLIVGFGTSPAVEDDPPKTVFGWVIHPRLMPQEEPGDNASRQTARYYPLSAVISVPSWWKSLKVAVRASWVEGDSAEPPKQESALYSDNYYPDKYHIPIPGSVREIKEKLRYEVRTEPYIDFDTMDKDGHGTHILEMGRPARIILEGGRLWRSTVVTMGDQQADKIEALPDMTGIIAEFNCVRPPLGVLGAHPEEEVKNFPISVWTSEGVTATPWTVVLHEFIPRNKSDKNGSEGKNTKDLPCFLEESARDKKENTLEPVILIPQLPQQQAPDH
jgi:hypothetical protein